MKSYATNDKGGTRLPSELERRSKSVALKNKKAKKKPEYKSGYEQHLAEQKEGKRIEKEERANRHKDTIKAIRI